MLIGGDTTGCIMDAIAQKKPNSRTSKNNQNDKAATGSEPREKPGPCGRMAHRNRVPQAHQPCELKVDANILPAALVNESKTGFAVLIDCLDGLEIGKEVELHTDLGWFTAQIVYISEVVPCGCFVNKCDSLFQLGVKKTGCMAILGDN
jgi:hypothetical protein